MGLTDWLGFCFIITNYISDKDLTLISVTLKYLPWNIAPKLKYSYNWMKWIHDRFEFSCEWEIYFMVQKLSRKMELFHEGFSWCSNLGRVFKVRYLKNNLHLLRLILPISRKSMSLPGVAITTSHPFSTSRSWGPLGAPPKTHVFLILLLWPNWVATSWICWANSL